VPEPYLDTGRPEKLCELSLQGGTDYDVEFGDDHARRDVQMLRDGSSVENRRLAQGVSQDFGVVSHDAPHHVLGVPDSHLLCRVFYPFAPRIS